MKEKKIPGIANIVYDKNDAILTIQLDYKSDISLEKAKLITLEASNLSGNDLHANLVDIRHMTYMSGDARKYFASQYKKTIVAVAIISNAAFHKPLANIYLKFTRPALPTKIFNNEEEARSWLVEMLKTKKI